MTSTDKEKEVVMSGSKLDDEIAELSKKRHEIEQSNVEREMKLKEATLEKRLKEIEERERKDKKELEMMKAILHERELEISNREVMMKRKETEWEEKLIARDRDMKIYEQRLKDMERTMIERFDSLEKDMKLRESMTEEKEADVRRREESLERKIHERKEEIIDVTRGLQAESLSMREGKLNSETRDVDMIQIEKSTGLKEIELKYNNESSEQKGKGLSESEQALHDLDKQIRELQVKKELLYSKSKDELNTERKEYKEGESKDKINRERVEVAKSKDDTKYTSTLESVKDNLNVKLNLTQYSGAELRPRNEATFEEWKMEVESVQATYSEIVVMQAIRKSLKDQAKRIMLHLGPNTTVEEILLKMEDAFGNVASKDSILSPFFMAEQEENETIVEWGL
ncbi:trichohyalin-like [Mercenaria mercenaria]|uniref:trichohyalin-like n=1 Tax=Mercenaria mercenaria TaxID=6596 RepID=UPI00234E4ADF|nr:trichohyalin-like [Mercenaria mercenaria]